MDDLIKQGATAFKAGDLETARKLLAEAGKQSLTMNALGDGCTTFIRPTWSEYYFSNKWFG